MKEQTTILLVDNALSQTILPHFWSAQGSEWKSPSMASRR
jgi:hypothetical protein